MAEGKQSFILYTDCKETVELLSDEQAGKLLKHILRYVNDENPIQDDKFVELVFTPIKLQLKRDLQKWDEIRADRSKAGKLSAEKRKQQASTKATHVESVQQSSTNPTVNGTENATASENANAIDNYIFIEGKIVHLDAVHSKASTEEYLLSDIELIENAAKNKACSKLEAEALMQKFVDANKVGSEFSTDTYGKIRTHFMNWLKFQKVEPVSTKPKLKPSSDGDSW